MYKIDFNNPIHIHFIGIGGISMSGLAKILLSEGFTVSGSDAHSSALTDELIGDGCIVSVPQSAGNITIQQQFTRIIPNSRQLRKRGFQCLPVQSFLDRL